MGRAAADTPSHSAANEPVPCGAARNGEFQRIVLEHSNAVRAFWPPTGNNFDQTRCNRAELKTPPFSRIASGPAGCAVRRGENRPVAA